MVEWIILVIDMESNNLIKVSIIVPVFNSEKTLHRCMESLVKQTLKSVEIILINDGSTDSSGDICLSYAEKYKNIKYINQRNQGVSASRNVGIKNANGEFLLFCDSDDYYSLDACEAMYILALMNDSDVVVGGVNKKFESTNQTVISESDEDKASRVMCLFENYRLNQIWATLYRRDVIVDNQLYFDTEMSIAEDLDWNCRVLKSVNKIDFCESIVYNYVLDNDNSLSKKFYKNHYSGFEKSSKSIRELFVDCCIENTGIQKLLSKLSNDLWIIMSSISNSNCYLNMREKIDYIQGCRSTDIYKELTSLKGYLTFIKKFLIKIKPVWLQVFLISLVR